MYDKRVLNNQQISDGFGNISYFMFYVLFFHSSVIRISFSLWHKALKSACKI